MTTVGRCFSQAIRTHFFITPQNLLCRKGAGRMELRLAPDGLRAVCTGLDNVPEKIGILMLEILARFRNEGIV